MAEDMLEFQSGLADIFSGDGGNGLQNFSAVSDVPPIKTLFLSVSGEVLVGNPGIDAELTFAIPQGFNPSILLLRIVLQQRPGIWPQVLVWKRVYHSRMLSSYGEYKQVHIDGPGGGLTLDIADRQ